MGDYGCYNLPMSEEKPVTHEAPTRVGEATGDSGFPEFPISNWDRYRFISFIGEGGMGLVYKASDPQLGRIVALKFIRTDTPDNVRRFLQEARAQARVEHDHVCKIYETGNVEGKHYIAMQYIDGRPLNRIAQKITLEQKVRLIRDVAEGIHEAHKMGLIHRDIKPGNIIVEETENGLHPYVLDFGLVREIQSQGATVTGVLVGTPYYMAPEQAWGEPNQVDRRADVYSLGATLYEILSGKLPLEGDTTLTVLKNLLEQEPRPLRERVPGIPSDLETIVSKTLEKEPQRRYDTARAFAEDLQRFLDGDPIRARRATITYRMIKHARKHRALVLVSTLALIAILISVSLGVRAQWQAARRAELAQRFGQQVEKMEGIMRLARMSPLHDVTPQKEIVRRRMAGIELQMNEIGEISQGAGHYALGRGYLSLDDNENAFKHLKIAWDRDYRDPAAAYALGLALGRLFQKELQAAQKINSKEERDARIRQIEKQYRDPAVAYLQLSQGLEEASPKYVEGLIDFYQKQFTGALEKAQQALQEAPWLYEARTLMGNVYSYTGTQKEDSGDYLNAAADYRRGIEAYETAIQTGTSDAKAYEGLCGIYSHYTHMELFQTGGSLEPLQQPAINACRQAVLADPEDMDALITLSQLYAHFGRYQINRGDDPESNLKLAIQAARDAIRVKPDARAYNMVAVAYRFRAEYESTHGMDPRGSADQIILHQQKASELDPRDPKNFENLGSAHMIRADYELSHGLNPAISLNEAVTAYKKCAEIIVKSYSCWNSLANTMAIRLDYEIERGIDPTLSFEEAKKAYEKAKQLNPKYAHVFNNLGNLYESRGLWEMRNGKDPRPFLQEALSLFQKTIELNPAYQHPYANSVVTYRYLAEYELMNGRDPSMYVARGLEASNHALQIINTEAWDHMARSSLYLIRAQHEAAQQKNPADAWKDCRETAGRAIRMDAELGDAYFVRGLSYLQEAQWKADARMPVGASLDQAESDLRKAIELNSLDSDAQTQMARVQWLRGAAFTDRGLDAVRHALQANPRNAEALAVKGLLLLQKKETAAARESFQSALLINANLNRQYSRFLK